MGKLRDRKNRHDDFYRRAKRESYAARSVYKLEEIDRRFKLMKAGQRVLDLGCRPGSWMQYAAARVGPRGMVVGLDREPVDIALPPHVTTLVGDVLEIDVAELRQGCSCFQLVMSDMAPDTTGVAFTDQVRSAELTGRALDIALAVGCPNGAFVAKLLMGEGFEPLLARLRETYASAKTVRPQATRKSSTEVYLVGTGKKAGAGKAEPEAEPAPASSEPEQNA
ncbi:MAG: RlmE family RNA methyltransferase [Myxococcales bacterium]|nr:RlmE family RNA methyltransferase [Myxococcales bacterium]